MSRVLSKKSNPKINNNVQEKVNKVISELNSSAHNSSGRTSPIRSNNSSVLGKSKRPVIIK